MRNLDIKKSPRCCRGHPFGGLWRLRREEVLVRVVEKAGGHGEEGEVGHGAAPLVGRRVRGQSVDQLGAPHSLPFPGRCSTLGIHARNKFFGKLKNKDTKKRFNMMAIFIL